MASTGTGNYSGKIYIFAVLTAKTEPQIIKTLVLRQIFPGPPLCYILKGDVKEMIYLWGMAFLPWSLRLTWKPQKIAFVSKSTDTTHLYLLLYCSLPSSQDWPIWPPTLFFQAQSLLSIFSFGASEHLWSQHQVQTGTCLESTPGSAFLFSIIFNGYAWPTFHLRISINRSQGKQAHRIKCFKKSIREGDYLVYM